MRPDYAISYPSNIASLARLIHKSNSVPKIKTIICVGETLQAEATQTIGEVFGARIGSRYSASEIGAIALGCPYCGAYHACEEAVLVEILNPDGRTAAPGEVGQVVVTALYNYAMPMLRYAIGDYAERGMDDCRIGLMSIARILGRSRNMFRFRDGSMRFPEPLFSDLNEIVRFRQFRLIQHNFEDVEFQFVPLPGSNIIYNSDDLQYYFLRIIHPSINLTVTPVSSIERSASGKFEDCLSHVSG